MISDESIANKQIEYYERGVLKKEVRSYEVSLWTLQDTFITVLKWSDVEQRGRIENPKMTLSTDGTQNFEFSIPMYIWLNGERIENPNWYTIHDGNLLAATRKIKVIFNKGKSNEAVYEFIILDVTETHDNDILTCEVKCEGLAFHELGKIGYNYSLSQEDFILDYEKWAKSDSHNEEEEPIQNIDYWCGKINLKKLPTDINSIDPRQWYYKVSMAYENNYSDDKIYEQAYVTSWKIDGDTQELVANAIGEQQEKARPIEASQSNIYNITQSLAEAFQVFCRYEYGYDENYHIISRTVVFYNSFRAEQDGISSILYPYSSTAISRNKDATNLTTKLYVLNLEDESAFDGARSIMNVEANKTRENYILNFNYMRDIGNVDKEQYDKIAYYEKIWRALNLELIRLQNNLAAYQQQQPELEASWSTCNKSIEVANKEINQNQALKAELLLKYGNNTGYISIPEDNPDSRFVVKSGKKYIIDLSDTNKGIDPQSVRVYTAFHNTAVDDKYHLLNSEKFIKVGTIKKITDSAGNLIQLELKPNDKNYNMPSHMFLTYNYNPFLYYDNIINMWSQRISTDTKNRKKYERQLYGKELDGEEPSTVEPELPGLLAKIKEVEEDIDAKLEEKQQSILKFEQMMGPALREGYWQPENYMDYGKQKKATVTFKLEHKGEALAGLPAALDNKLGEDVGEGCAAVWDQDLFDKEDDLFYYSGFETVGSPREQIAHYCIDLSGVPSTVIGPTTDLTQISFVFDDPVTGNESAVQKLHAFGFGSNAQVRYLACPSEQYTGGYKIIPVLVLTDDTDLADYSKRNLKESGNNQRIGNIHAGLDDTGTDADVIIEGEVYSVPLNKIFIPSKSSFLVYPRIKFSSLQVKTDTSSLFISYTRSTNSHILLDKFNDYYFNTKLVQRTEGSSNNYYPMYFFTIKPEVLFKLGVRVATTSSQSSISLQVKYIISNADVAIYLDALEVSKENAFPKVSYEVTPSAFDTTILNNLYKQLARIITINDTELKLEDAFGYISSIDLDLDNPWQDTITVQNYTNKFEDLFSSIVAATEAMQKSEGMIGNMLAGGIPISPEAFAETLDINQTILNAYWDSQFDSSQVVTDRLTQLFDELGLILGNAQSALGNLHSLSEEGAAILGGLSRNVAEDLAVHIYTGATRPSKFKMGDLWIKTETDEDGNTYTKRMVATSNSGNLAFNRKVDPATTGFTTTYDGSLASITGANMAYDAEEGTVDIYGEHNIDIKSGGSIYIGANDHIAMVGNKTVNIGGSRINIISDDAGNVNNITSGILLQAIRAKNNSSAPITFIQTEILAKRNSSKIASADDDFKAAVDSHLVIPSTGTSAIFKHFINPTISYTVSKSDVLGNDGEVDYDKVEALLKNNINIASSVQLSPIAIDMQAAVLQLSASSSIKLLASDGSNTSAIVISTEAGIKLASNKGIFLHSEQNENAVETEITSKHFLAGASGGTTGTALEITKNYVIIAAGSTSRSTIAANGIDLSNSSITGMELRSNKFGLAIKSGTTYSGVIIDNTGILVGVGTNPTTSDNGSYIYLKPQKLEIGSHADLYINTKNCKLQTNQSNSSTQNIGNTIFAIGTNLNGIEPTTDFSKVDASKVNFLVNQNGAYISGTVYASGGKIGGFTIASDRLYRSYKVNTETKFVGMIAYENSNQYSPAFYAGASNNSATGATFLVRQNGTLTAVGADISGKITTTSGSIGGWQLTTTALYHTYTDANNATKYVGIYTGNRAFFAGADAAWGDQAVFYVTKEGKLSCTDANIQGVIKATSGIIGSTAKHFTIAGNDTKGYIYSGPNALTATTAGIYVGTDGICLNGAKNFVLLKADIANAKVEIGRVDNKNVMFSLGYGTDNVPTLQFNGALNITGGVYTYTYNHYDGGTASASATLTDVKYSLSTKGSIIMSLTNGGLVNRTGSHYYNNTHSFALDNSGVLHCRQLQTGDTTIAGSLYVSGVNPSTINGPTTITTGTITTLTSTTATITNLQAKTISGSTSVTGTMTLSGIINGASHGTTGQGVAIKSATGRYLLVTGGSTSAKGSIWWIQQGVAYKICGGTAITSVTVSNASTYNITITASSDCYYQLYKIA